MREWKITCDHCGIEIIGNPFTAVIERVGREQDASVMDGETVTLDLCEKCVDELQSWKMIHTSGDISRTIRHTSKEMSETDLFDNVPEWDDAPDQGAEPVTKPTETPPPKPKKMKASKNDVEVGKMIALRNAGWTYKQIAEEMKLTEKQVSNYLYNAKKREKK